MRDKGRKSPGDIVESSDESGNPDDFEGLEELDLDEISIKEDEAGQDETGQRPAESTDENRESPFISNEELDKQRQEMTDNLKRLSQQQNEPGKATLGRLKRRDDKPEIPPKKRVELDEMYIALMAGMNPNKIDSEDDGTDDSE